MTNGNVKTFYIYSGLQSLGRGIWMGNILSLYIILLAESATGVLGLTPNELLGMTSAVTGVAMLASVLPGGILADKWSLKGTLIIGVISGSVGLGFLALGSSLVTVAAGLFFWGLFQGFSRPASETILANSTISGDRSRVYAKVHLIDQLGMGTGPLLNVILFLVLGDRWDLSILRIVMSVGILFSFLSALVILNIREEHSLGDESEALSASRTDNGDGAHRTALTRKAAKYIPHIFLLSSFLIGFGAGMTVKFFPVFFRSIYDLQPIAVQLIMGGGLLVTALFTVLAQKLSLRLGRALMIVSLQTLSISALVGMAFYPALWLIIPLFVLRGALMNASSPLSRSIVMDYVPKKHRGIWSGLQTIAWGLFWNVSALLGGFLIGDDNFRLCFLITAAIYVLGTSIVIPLIPIIHRESGHKSSMS